MRIILACEFYYPSVGGVQEVMRQIGERFAKAGHEVTVATTQMSERISTKIKGVSIREFRISGNVARGMVGEIDRYRTFILEQNYDVLIVKAAQQWTFDALIPILGSIKKPKIFIPCGFSGMFVPEYSEYFEQMPTWLQQFDRLIFYASDYRDINLARKHQLRNIAILSNGADENEFNVNKDSTFRARYGVPEDAFLVMTVGSLTGLKGHQEVAAAFEKCKFGDRPAFLMLIGNVPRGAAPEPRTMVGRFLKRARAMYEVGGIVRVAKWMLRPVLEKAGLRWVLTALGYRKTPHEPQLPELVARINADPTRRASIVDLPRTEIVQAYLNSDLFVFASRIEYSPLVLFEAAAAGLPFVTAPVGNAAEIARWTGGGVVCDATQDLQGHTRVDPTVLAEHMKHLAAQPDLLVRLGNAGRHAWQERFTWDKIFRSYERILEECLQKTAA